MKIENVKSEHRISKERELEMELEKYTRAILGFTNTKKKGTRSL
jgi:hypothetical protein